ncbi:Uu.00g087920.m01.CDS01 [Anthostomella pinea]|uniref:Uu.00g087920.m01.CDS01 n=1 Tax=Anthostomella pinea TaxID=933095 RepID=A0AAI8YJX3_9PEZI|nr:Uu.00g087920.m01.CDS01 [Anthostomella pinea]
MTNQIYHTMFKSGILKLKNAQVARAVTSMKNHARKCDVPYLLLKVNSCPGFIYGESRDSAAIEKYEEFVRSIQRGVYRCVVPVGAVELPGGG